MLFGLTSRGRYPSLKGIFPEREFAEDHISVRYRFEEAQDVDIPFDHFTCHADGRFHLKARDTRTVCSQVVQRCEPLGPRTSCFLHLQVFLDVPEAYPEEPVQPGRSVVLHVPPKTRTALEAMFSGAEYPLEPEMGRHLAARGPGLRPGVLLASGTLKGLIVPTGSLPDVAGREGTIVTFQFPIPDSRSLLKTFLFA